MRHALSRGIRHACDETQGDDPWYEEANHAITSGRELRAEDLLLRGIDHADASAWENSTESGNSHTECYQRITRKVCPNRKSGLVPTIVPCGTTRTGRGLLRSIHVLFRGPVTTIFPMMPIVTVALFLQRVGSAAVSREAGGEIAVLVPLFVKDHWTRANLPCDY